MDAGIVNRLISILSEPPVDRSDKEIQEILPYLTLKTFALGGMSKDTLIDVLKNAKHKKLKKNQFLKKAIGSNDRLYLVLTGRVTMFMEWQESVLPPIDEKDCHIRNVRQFGFKVDSLGPGKMVEERYRMENVHIITDVDTDLMIISKNLYERAMLSETEREEEEKDLFIKTHPFFSKWPEQKQNELKSAMIRRQYKHNEEIMKQGDDFSGLFFITKGRALLSAQPRKHKKQFEHVFEAKEMDKELEEIIRIHTPKKVNTMMSRGDTKGSLMVEQTYIRRLNGYVAAERMEFEKIVDICIISAGEIVGDTEFFLGFRANIFTVTTMSEGCEAFFLQENQLNNVLLKKKEPLSLKLMKFLCETKLIGRMSSSQGQKVTIFPRLVHRLRQVRIDEPKNLITSIDDKHLTKHTQKDHETTMEELDKSFLTQTFLKDKGPFLKPITPGTVYFKEIMRQRIAERTGTQVHKDTLKQTKWEGGPINYHSISKQLKESIVESVREGIRTEKVIKRWHYSWNKNKLPKI